MDSTEPAITVELLDDWQDPGVSQLLVGLAVDEQRRYNLPQPSQLVPKANFVAENHLFIARRESGQAVGVCWCVLFDPGTGLEAEVAELYVDPLMRGRGVAVTLLQQAQQLFTQRQVTFTCVWTHHSNDEALAAYRKVGFAPTDQTVLTWFPHND